MWATLLRLSVRSTPFSLTVVGAIVLIGIYGITQIQIDAVPDITNNQVQVFAYAPGYSAAEVELLVTRPIESALATVPHRIEWRSISRMGLSLITLVFAEGVSPYESRSMIAERLLSIQDQLPAGVRPEIGPMSTGLSEAYQYILRPAVPVPLTDLRFIQDWIVRRALLETPGVADVSSFGGYVRRWDILLWPEALMRYQLSLSEVERALRNSNQLIGGGYLERGPSTFSLRAEGTWKKPSDILSAVVAERHGRPIRLSDIGEVREGHLPRYGALVEDTVGEAVGGIVLIRKGENTAKVIQHLQERIAALETRLPHGIRIEPFLNRERLIHRIVRTVVTNLSEAALIVIALLTCILGSWRAGLLVGSVIPLSMCFALGLMSLTGISANLMSLGAIDFGLIVDGTVILVEAVIVRLPHFSDRLQAAEEGSIHIRQASLFGELVVLSVYLPLLLLSGVEGRMFRPMVITMMFALTAALLLSLTFVPWASGRFLRSPTASFSEKLGSLLLRGGREVFRWTLRHKFLPGIVWFALVGTGIMLFFISETLFLPELDEGALAVETRLPLGSSLPQTIRYAEEVHRLVLRQFPHVFSGAVAKIGTSEIPMDPMFVESADLILTLNESPPISRPELSDSLKKLLHSHFPGIFFGIQQPIQMRFNELLAGARTDILIRIIGPDLDTLGYWGEKAAQICREVPGVADLAQPLFFGNQQLI
ncbi:MAG: efflux RND transporter permease subunit, partial [Bacteroidia bacterium]|nr:efflux RND transporter permease subunit [Bacteroidia bacterium]